MLLSLDADRQVQKQGRQLEPRQEGLKEGSKGEFEIEFKIYFCCVLFEHLYSGDIGKRHSLFCFVSYFWVYIQGLVLARC